MILEDAGIDEDLTTYFTISLGVTGLISCAIGVSMITWQQLEYFICQIADTPTLHVFKMSGTL